MMKSMVCKVAGGLALMAGFLACGAGSAGENAAAPGPDPAAGESAEVTVVPAGPESTELGVSRWETTDEAYYGLQADGAVVAEFHTFQGGLESVVPEAAVVDSAHTSFPELTQRYYDAFVADVANMPPQSIDPSAAVEASGTVIAGCFVSLRACFPARDQVFAATGLLCTCQPGSAISGCPGSQVTLSCPA